MVDKLNVTKFKIMYPLIWSTVLTEFDIIALIKAIETYVEKDKKNAPISCEDDGQS